jgi:hypothetical protein
MTSFIVHVDAVVVDGDRARQATPTLEASAVAVELRRLYRDPTASAGDVRPLGQGAIVSVAAHESLARALAVAIHRELAGRGGR